jgi:hypothetical protein
MLLAALTHTAFQPACGRRPVSFGEISPWLRFAWLYIPAIHKDKQRAFKID